MPTRAEIDALFKSATSASPQDAIRRAFLKRLHRYTKRDTILYCSAFATGKGFVLPPPLMSIGLMDIQGLMASLKGLKGKELDLIIHSPGGSLEAADQIVQYLRNKYDHIRAFIPQNAMSAATMIACACDEIWMGNQSALGPIDPQLTIPSSNGTSRSVPAQSILDEFEQILKQVKDDPRLAALWVTKIQSYPPGFLHQCEATINGSKAKVAEWLGKFMFRNDSDGTTKASTIASWLGSAANHSSHGRPIGWQLARSKGLVVKRLEDDDKLQDLMLSVYHASLLTFDTTHCFKLVENHNGKGVFFQMQLAPMLQKQPMPAAKPPVAPDAPRPGPTQPNPPVQA